MQVVVSPHPVICKECGNQEPGSFLAIGLPIGDKDVLYLSYLCLNCGTPQEKVPTFLLPS